MVKMYLGTSQPMWASQRGELDSIGLCVKGSSNEHGPRLVRLRAASRPVRSRRSALALLETVSSTRRVVDWRRARGDRRRDAQSAFL
jgi:hypothetical protein